LNLSGGAADIDTLSGEKGTVLEEMDPGGNGRVEVRGTTWSARNMGASHLARGNRCIVISTDRLTLVVKAEEAHP